jgi:serine/threonine-protein kinase HipA
MSSWSPIGNAYVYSAHAIGDPVPVGEVAMVGSGFVFRYANSWLARPNAFAIDPLNLPLTTRQYSSARMFGALDDATPDNWGRRVLLATHRQHPQNEIEWLLASRGAGVGCLLFSASRTKLPTLHEPPQFEDLEKIMLALDQIELGDVELPPELARLFEFGSSMGGARPKVTVTHEGKEWIAKLGRSDDVFDQPRAEFASLQMAQAAGLPAAGHKLVEVAGRPVLMVERFDRHEGTGREHYLSANSLISAEKPRMQVGSVEGAMSYSRIADALKKISDDATFDMRDLFRRMCFNVLIGNSDDHAKQHGFLLANIAASSYCLSPVFDVLPHPTQLGLQALIIGSEGRVSTISNLMSTPERFGIGGSDEARTIIEDVYSVTREAAGFFEAAGASNADIAMLAKVCTRFEAELRPQVYTGPRLG